jgi:hypothetical protein
MYVFVYMLYEYVVAYIYTHVYVYSSPFLYSILVCANLNLHRPFWNLTNAYVRVPKQDTSVHS